MKILLRILNYLGVYFVSFVLLSFAISKFFNAQFQVWNYIGYTPLKEVEPLWLAWSFFGKSYAYNLFIGIAEAFAAVLILFSRTRLLGLVMTLAIYLNIVAVDLAFEVVGALTHAIIELLVVIFLLIPYLGDLKKFIWDMHGKFQSGENAHNKFINVIMPPGFILIVSTVMTLLLHNLLTSEDKRIGAYKVSQLLLNEDTLNATAGKFTKSPMLFLSLEIPLFSRQMTAHCLEATH